MPRSDYLNLFLDAGISFESAQEKHGRCLDELCRQQRLDVTDIIGVGEKDGELCVVHRQGIVLASERGMFNKRIELDNVAPVSAIARLRREIEGFKGRGGLCINAYDASGNEVFKLSWGLGGPEWVVPLAERQSEHVYDAICAAMDQ